MLAIPLTFFLIPKAKLTDSINVDESGKFVGTTPEAPKKAVTEGVEVSDVQKMMRKLDNSVTFSA